MSNEQITVAAMKKDYTGFKASNEIWYQMDGGKGVQLPPGFNKGDTVDITYTVKSSGGRDYYNIQTIKHAAGTAPQQAAAPTKTTPPQGKGSSFDRDLLIVRQNALTNAVNYFGGSNATTEDVLNTMAVFADAVYNGVKRDATNTPAPTGTAEQSTESDDELPF